MTERTPETYYGGRNRAALAAQFDHWGRTEVATTASPLYTELAMRVAQDAELLELAAATRDHQPPPNMLFAAVQYLLLGGTEHELARHYPVLLDDGEEADELALAFPRLRDFCARHREEITELIRSRRTQTCVVRRCICLLPAFAHILQERPGPLAMLEVGPSAGLNLRWDRYAYEYRRKDASEEPLRWGDPEARLVLDAELRGEHSPPFPSEPGVIWRTGVDLNPIDLSDPDQLLWLRALIFPEHVERHAQLAAAIATAAEVPVRLVRGDASEKLPELLAEAPTDATLVVYATHALYQFPRPALIATLKAMQAHSRARPLCFVSMEGTGDGNSYLDLTRYTNGHRAQARLATCNPHGHWLEWSDS